MFQLQLFGDNDTVTSAAELKIRQQFGADDDRLLSLPNPRSNITAADINNAFSDVTTTQIIVGDKDGAAFTGISKAYREEKTIRKLDLT